MAYVILKDFRDTKDGKKLNEAGHFYPREGLEVTEERLTELREKEFIVQVVDEEEQKADEEGKEEFPMHKGGGSYVLSNGKSIKGKEAAIEAEKALEVEEQPKDGE